MASKFGGEQAAKNAWVMQQNLARHKSMLGYVHKAKMPKPKTAPAVKPPPPAEPETPPSSGTS